MGSRVYYLHNTKECQLVRDWQSGYSYEIIERENLEHGGSYIAYKILTMSDKCENRERFEDICANSGMGIFIRKLSAVVIFILSELVDSLQ